MRPSLHRLTATVKPALSFQLTGHNRLVSIDWDQSSRNTTGPNGPIPNPLQTEYMATTHSQYAARLLLEIAQSPDTPLKDRLDALRQLAALKRDRKQDKTPSKPVSVSAPNTVLGTR